MDPSSFVAGTRSGVAKVTSVICRVIYQVYSYSEKDKMFVYVCPLEGHKGPVLDVAWAPNVGRFA